MFPKHFSDCEGDISKLKGITQGIDCTLLLLKLINFD